MINAAAGAACTALAAVTVLALLRAPTLAVLVELCRGEQRARFWWRVVTIEVFAGTALSTSLALLLVARADSWRWPMAMVQGGAAGLLLSLALVALAVMLFQRERDRHPGRPDVLLSSR